MPPFTDMELLGTVQIMGHEWRVIGGRPIPEYASGTTFWGLCVHNECAIYVALCDTDGTPRSPSQIANTFLHELNHAIDDKANTGLSEEQIDQFSNCQYAVIRDNPGLMESLFEGRE